jgi:hypothetical protein
MAPDGTSFHCRDCGMVSYSPHDVIECYCVHCHAYKPPNWVTCENRAAARQAIGSTQRLSLAGYRHYYRGTGDR